MTNLKNRIGKLESKLIPLSESSVLIVSVVDELPPSAAYVAKAVAEAKRRCDQVAVVISEPLAAWAR
jgi:hypothetical protein